MRKPVPARQQTGRVGQLLFVAQQAAQALAIERLEPLGLSPRAWGVLSTLAESGPLTQIELATTMSIDRTAMVYLIDELEAQTLVERVRTDPTGAPVSEKLKALLDIAAAVQRNGKQVTPELVAAARAHDADDVEIHDTVLIAAAFCMFNRYVDGLATALPEDPDFYTERARRIVASGYLGVLAEAGIQA